MALEHIDWDYLQTQHSGELVGKLRDRFRRGEWFEITPSQVSAEASCKPDEARKLLDAITDAGGLRKERRYVCPCERQENLTAAQAAQETCVHCMRAFCDLTEGGPVARDIYIHEGMPTRDVRWVLALHGMNTRGAWQEEFNWLVSRTYGYSVPVAIYKYGVVRPGAVLKFRQQQLMRQLIGRIQRLSRQTDEVGFGGRPDVIAHSFGTWLLGHTLEQDKELRVGRVILAGSILRPDFSWKKLIERDQVEAVLCHFAPKDFWAGVAHYVIPDSGPSGRRGFNHRDEIVHIVARGLGHSDFFQEDLMPRLFREVWQPFLTRPAGQLHEVASDLAGVRPWRQSSWPMRATIPRYLLLLFALGVLGVAAATFALGIKTLVATFF